MKNPRFRLRKFNKKCTSIKLPEKNKKLKFCKEISFKKLQEKNRHCSQIVYVSLEDLQSQWHPETIFDSFPILMAAWKYSVRLPH